MLVKTTLLCMYKSMARQCHFAQWHFLFDDIRAMSFCTMIFHVKSFWQCHFMQYHFIRRQLAISFCDMSCKDTRAMWFGAMAVHSMRFEHFVQ
jgi:hypothetical protein